MKGLQLILEDVQWNSKVPKDPEKGMRLDWIVPRDRRLGAASGFNESVTPSLAKNDYAEFSERLEDQFLGKSGDFTQRSNLYGNAAMVFFPLFLFQKEEANGVFDVFHTFLNRLPLGDAAGNLRDPDDESPGLCIGFDRNVELLGHNRLLSKGITLQGNSLLAHPPTSVLSWERVWVQRSIQ